MIEWDKQAQFEMVERFVEDFSQKAIMDMKADILLDKVEDHGIHFDKMTKQDLIEYALEIIETRLHEGFEDNKRRK